MVGGSSNVEGTMKAGYSSGQGVCLIPKRGRGTRWNQVVHSG